MQNKEADYLVMEKFNSFLFTAAFISATALCVFEVINLVKVEIAGYSNRAAHGNLRFLQRISALGVLSKKQITRDG